MKKRSIIAQIAMTENLIKEQLTLDATATGRRLDQVLADHYPDFSRSQIARWIVEGQILLNGDQVKPRQKVMPGTTVTVTVQREPDSRFEPEPMTLNILFEDEHIIVLDKPAGLVVHPAAGNWTGTLLNGLLAHDAALAELPRAGIVHRLDKLTSGVMVVARSHLAHQSLVSQLAERTMSREYRAIVYGEMVAGMTIDEPIDRHPRDRVRMAVVANGKPAVSHVRVLERFHGFSRVAVQLESGRTHQIRVHMAHAGFPVAGDPVYGGRLRWPKDTPEAVQVALKDLGRQALHARHLTLTHPGSDHSMTFSAAVPADMQRVIDALRDG